MALTEKAALSIFGVEDLSKFENEEALKTFVDGAWVKRENAKDDPEIRTALMGKVNRVARTRLSGIAKEYDLELDSKLMSEGDPVDIIPEIGKALKSKFGDIDELRDKVSKALPEDTIKDWEKKIKSTEKERDTFKSQAAELQGKYDGLFNEVKTSKAKSVEEKEWNNALAGIQFHQGVDDLKKEGFKAIAKNKYRIELDEEFTPKLVDAKGSPIKHPKKGGEFLTLSEALKLEATELKLVGTSVHGNKPAPTRPAPMTMKPDVNPQPKRERYIANPML